MISKKLAMSCAASITLLASAATYHIDFENGDDTANGGSPGAAWKHSPGDPNATGNPKSVKLAPGDKLLFKGGVAYHGTINITQSGSADKPIVLDGNSAGKYGKGRAILDGGKIITGWKRCASAGQAEGSKLWKNIFYADVDLDISSNFKHGKVVPHRKASKDVQAPWQRVILVDGDRRLLPIAQSPKPKDTFYPDLPGDFYQSSHRLEVRGRNTIITDEKNLKGDKSAYDGMFLGIHGGNNHVYFAAVKAYDPAKKQLQMAAFKERTYPTTRYALYNSVRLIENPGEWAIKPIEGGRVRMYLLPERLKKGQPVNIGYPNILSGFVVAAGTSHVNFNGFLIQRFAGGIGGICVKRGRGRANNIHISNCEIRFVSGASAIGLNYCDKMTVENCYVHHCPSWTTAVFNSRVQDFVVRNCRLIKNSGSGIRHYECKRGKLKGNTILDHYGMHSSAINVYEGCADMVIEDNYIQNTATINRNAENIVFRNNVIDSQGKSAVCFGMWSSGRVGGRALKNIQFLNNTFVNVNHGTSWSTAILGQRRRGTSSPQGLVIRNNILDRVREDLPGTFENNIYTRKVESRFMGKGCQVVTDTKELFKDPENGDFRRKPGGPQMDVGANVAPPPELTER